MGAIRLGSLGWITIALLVFLVAFGTLAWKRAEGTAPSVEAPAEVLIGAVGKEIEVSLSDASSGIRAVQVSLLSAEDEAILLDEAYAGGWVAGATSKHAKHLSVPINPDQLQLRGDSGVLRITATDWSWRGNRTQRDVSLAFDFDAPVIRVSSGLTYVRRGGAGSVRYRVSEATAHDGVQIGGTGSEGGVFYRGFPAPGLSSPEERERVALFAVATDAPGKPQITVLAEDPAGNATRASWPVVVRERVQPEGLVTLPQRFLDEIVVSMAQEDGIPLDDLAVAFHRINTEVRTRNEARIRELLRASEPRPLFRGPFEQLRNSKVTSRFAEKRTYFVGPKRVSQATHFGYDLASTAAAPITAANAGRVAHAGALGIYGQCVLIDHGIGLGSLYGHLSRLDVSPGDFVEKGEVLGRSGATGLAGGDHLHFAILVGETYVDPMEWWDPKWVASHIAVEAAP